jgi:hypothetical protein
MKTKNFLLTGALLIVALFSVNGVMAEGPSDYAQSGETTVNIILNSMQAIVVNHDVVNLEYTTLGDYTNGVESPLLTNHLTVYSVGPFAVKVTSNGIFKNGNNKSISAGTVTITPEENETTLGTITPVVITTGEQITGESLITSSNGGGFNKTYNVKYRHKFADNATAFENELDTYTAQVTYEIIPAN